MHYSFFYRNKRNDRNSKNSCGFALLRFCYDLFFVTVHRNTPSLYSCGCYGCYAVTVKNIGCKKRKTKNPDDGRRVVTTQNQQLNNSRRHLWRDARTIMNVLCRRPEG